MRCRFTSVLTSLLLATGACPAAAASVKKGVGAWHFHGIQRAIADVNVSWFYTWGPNPSGVPVPPGVEFVPMVWSAKDLSDAVLEDLGARGGTLLGFNEPDAAEQANMTVEEALDLWPQLMVTGRRLGSPAPAHDPRAAGSWLERFMAGARERGYRVDFVCVHRYQGHFDSEKDVADLEAFLNGVHEKFGLPIWLTEFAQVRWTQPTTYPPRTVQADFAARAVQMLDSLPFVERYAWFALPPSAAAPGLTADETVALYEEGGTPTPVGIAYRGHITTPSPERAPSAAPADAPTLNVDGYVEANYTHAFGRPASGVIAARGFDNRHATFALSNAVLGLRLDDAQVYGRVAFQFGTTPATYYQAEPSRPAEGGAGPVDATLWRHVQEAYGGWRPAAVPGLSLEGGVFLSQIGIEPLAIREAMQWSRSNLFFGLPFYHTGARVHQRWREAWVATLAVFNGWNSVIDNNLQKSVSVRLAYEGKRAEWACLYFGGREREVGGVLGNPWRHLVDAWLRVRASAWLDLALHANVGGERVAGGSVRWAAGALYGRVALSRNLSIASRTDVFFERAKSRFATMRPAIFWDADRVASQTTTLSYWAHERLRFMLEHRFDAASGPLYYRGTAMTPSARRQNTVTAGLVLSL